MSIMKIAKCEVCEGGCTMYMVRTPCGKLRWKAECGHFREFNVYTIEHEMANINKDSKKSLNTSEGPKHPPTKTLAARAPEDTP